MYDDPIVGEVRRVRAELAMQYDFDVARLFANWRRTQVQVGKRLVSRGPERKAEPGAAVDAQESAHR